MSARGRRGVLLFIAGGALALLAGRWVTGIYADWAFYHALGFDAVWRSKALHGAALAIGAFVLMSAFAFANLFAVRQSIVSLVLPRQLGNIEFGEAVPTRRLTLLAAAAAFALGVLFAVLPHDWVQAAVAWDGIRFAEIDPYMERDLGFYVTWLPWEMGLQARTIAAVLSVTAVVGALYASTPSVKWGNDGLYVSAWVRRHLSVLAGTIVLLVGWGWRLDRYARLTDGSGIWGTSALEMAFAVFDHRVMLLYLSIASFATIPVAAVLVWAGWNGNLRLAFTLVTALILGGPVASALLPIVARDRLGAVTAQAEERPYRATRMLYTRRAYGVDEIAVDSAGLARIPLDELGRRLSVWDPAALDRWQRVGVAGGGTGDSAATFIAWDGTTGGLTATLLRAGPDRLSVLSPWTATAVEPARSDAQQRPVIAVGEVGRSISGVIVRPGAGPAALLPDSTGRIAAPGFDGALTRLALAWSQQDPGLFFAAPPTPLPRVVLHRDVHARLRRAVPFLEAGPTVTPVVRGDSLHWVVELFSVADWYPLTEELLFNGRTRHYVRHAATSVVQGQTGRIWIVPVETPDAVTSRMLQQFPALFTARTAAPDWFFTERPPALDWGLVQGRAMARSGFGHDTIATRSLTRADDADADVANGPATLFQVDSTGGLAWGVPVDVPWAGRTVGLLVIRGGPDARTEYHDAAGAAASRCRRGGVGRRPPARAPRPDPGRPDHRGASLGADVLRVAGRRAAATGGRRSDGRRKDAHRGDRERRPRRRRGVRPARALGRRVPRARCGALRGNGSRPPRRGLAGLR
jgi:hypothetical protein